MVENCTVNPQGSGAKRTVKLRKRQMGYTLVSALQHSLSFSCAPWKKNELPTLALNAVRKLRYRLVGRKVPLAIEFKFSMQFSNIGAM